MDDHVLHRQLLKLYTPENLNTVSSWIISAFKAKQYDLLNDLARCLPDSVVHAGANPNKIFTQLMMRYHPDRLSSIHHEMIKAVKEGKLQALKNFQHLSKTLQFIEDRKESTTSQIHNQRSKSSKTSEMDMSCQGAHTFLSALKQHEYGNLDVVYHDTDLMSLEGDLELSGYGIQDLSGLELCDNLSGLDLSRNRIIDIWALSRLNLIEELNLSCNQITSIHALENMSYLKELDLSYNEIESLEPLYPLQNLAFVNLIGNPIHATQIRPLQQRGVLVIL